MAAENLTAKNDTNTIVLFISGAGLDVSIWDGVIQSIDTPSLCVDYSQFRQDNPEAGLNDYVQEAYRQYQSLGARSVVVVAHSIGGVIAVELVSLLGDACKALVFVCAAVPEPGRNFVSVFGFPQRILLPLLLRVAGTKPPESQIMNGLASGLSESQARKIADQFQPESRKLYTDKVSANSLPKISVAYILTTQDKELSEITQRRLSANLGAQVTEVASGHMPMISQPDTVAQVILHVL